MMIDPRWNTLLDMVESVCVAFLEILELLKKQKVETKLDCWDANIATQLVSFLTPFKNVSIELQAKKKHLHYT